MFRKKKNKKAMELSVNFLVIFILALVVFAFGLRLAYNLFNKGIETKATLDRQTSLEIEKLLDSGDKIVIPFDEQTIRKGQFGVYGLGIRNVLDTTGEKDTFRISVEFSNAFSQDGKQVITAGSLPSVNSQSLQSTLVRKNEVQKVPISIGVPKDAVSGRYVFNVKVFSPDNSQSQYGFTKQIIVIVP